MSRRGDGRPVQLHRFNLNVVELSIVARRCQSLARVIGDDSGHQTSNSGDERESLAHHGVSWELRHHAYSPR